MEVIDKHVKQKIHLDKEIKRHKIFWDNYIEKDKDINEKESAINRHLITLEVAIFTGIIILVKPSDFTLSLFIAIIILIVSMVSGIMLQHYEIKQMNDKNFSDLKIEQDMHSQALNSYSAFVEGASMAQAINTMVENSPTNPLNKKQRFKFINKINLEVVEIFFKFTFILSLFFLLIHFINLYNEYKFI